MLVESGVKVEVAETQYAGHATLLAREAARAGRDMVVAAGGDGTIAEVANGLLGSATALGVIAGDRQCFGQRIQAAHEPTRHRQYPSL